MANSGYLPMVPGSEPPQRVLCTDSRKCYLLSHKNNDQHGDIICMDISSDGNYMFTLCQEHRTNSTVLCIYEISDKKIDLIQKVDFGYEASVINAMFYRFDEPLMILVLKPTSANVTRFFIWGPECYSQNGKNEKFGMCVAPCPPVKIITQKGTPMIGYCGTDGIVRTYIPMHGASGYPFLSLQPEVGRRWLQTPKITSACFISDEQSHMMYLTGNLDRKMKLLTEGENFQVHDIWWKLETPLCIEAMIKHEELLFAKAMENNNGSSLKSVLKNQTILENNTSSTNGDRGTAHHSFMSEGVQYNMKVTSGESPLDSMSSKSAERINKLLNWRAVDIFVLPDSPLFSQLVFYANDYGSITVAHMTHPKKPVEIVCELVPDQNQNQPQPLVKQESLTPAVMRIHVTKDLQVVKMTPTDVIVWQLEPNIERCKQRRFIIPYARLNLEAEGSPSAFAVHPFFDMIFVSYRDHLFAWTKKQL